jgi:hypothetical protein
MILETPNQISVGSGSDEASQVQVVKDIAKVLLDVVIEDDASPSSPLVLERNVGFHVEAPQSFSRYIISYWHESHMPTFGFAKAATAHACAFNVLLDRLLLETNRQHHCCFHYEIIGSQSICSQHSYDPIALYQVVQQQRCGRTKEERSGE